MGDRKYYGEDRLIAYGHAAKRLHVCVFTMRRDVTRIISGRKANDREIRKYGR
ncbi:MAG: BrnT family toxin [Rhizobiaceae bacterium]